MKKGSWLRHPARFVALLALLLSGEAVMGARASELEYRVKAAFLYNFTKFVDWPAEVLENGDRPLTICVVGEDPFGRMLERTLTGKTTHSRTLEARRITALEQLEGCQVLFIGYSDTLHLRRWVEHVDDSPVLTVGEESRFVELGGMIEFVIVDGKVRFDINHEAAQRARLQMSSKLLNLARTVVR